MGTTCGARRVRFPVIVGGLQIMFIVLFAIFSDYDDTAKPGGMDTSTNNQYATFQDVHVMMFVGFGFLMTFLKRYGYSAVGVNFLVAALCIQWATLVRGFLHLHDGKFTVHLGEMLTADFAAATVLISFGALIGKTSPSQLIIMAMIEIVIAQVNEKYGLTWLRVTDAGESMFVHIFGAYFGLAAARVLYRDDVTKTDGDGSTYHSDIFAMVGTIFLWLYWPSFNGGALSGVEQNRAFLNTFFSLAACCVVSFIVSWITEGTFDMIHIQNSTLAGGVAIGTAADLLVKPYGALLVGAGSAFVSVFGYKYLHPILARKLLIHDTCGVHNLHGMPGVMAAIVGAIMSYLANASDYGMVLFEKFPARVPSEASGAYYEQLKNELGPDAIGKLDELINANSTSNLGRSASVQAGYQLAAMSLTLAVAIVGGTITGFILRIPKIWDEPPNDRIFADDLIWEIIPDFNPYTQGLHLEKGGHGEKQTYKPEGLQAYKAEDTTEEAVPLTSVQPK